MIYKRLAGEADPNEWDFTADHGPLPNPVGHTFPIVTHDRVGRWRLVGTGFYISSHGIFLTAKHVVEEALTQGRQTRPLVILHLRSRTGLWGPQELLLRPITQCWVGDTADIALGMAMKATNLRGEVLSHWKWQLSWRIPSVGAKIGTYAFPNYTETSEGERQCLSFTPNAYFGAVQEVAESRDRVLIPFPYMQVDFRIHGAASGGPVFGNEGHVVAVNCSELAPHGPAFVTQIRCLQDAFLDNVLAENGAPAARITFTQLVEGGEISVVDFEPKNLTGQHGSLLRLDDVLPSAAAPIVEIGTFG